MPALKSIDTSMGEKAKRLPPRPRIILNGIVILPAVDDDWQPIEGEWMLPGRKAALSTQEVQELALVRKLTFDLIK